MVFTAIPLASVTAFLPSVLSTSNPTEGLLSCLGILSLLATAYTMRHSPLRPDRKGKKPVTAEDERLALIRTALLPVNGVVCLLLTAAYFLIGPYASRPVLYLVPGGESYNVLLAKCLATRVIGQDFILLHCLSSTCIVMLAIVLVARETMLSVDLSVLKDLQYEYKGA